MSLKNLFKLKKNPQKQKQNNTRQNKINYKIVLKKKKIKKKQKIFEN